MKKAFIISIFLSLAIITKAQDTIVLLTGHIIPCKVYQENENVITCEFVKKGREEKLIIDTYRVFSIKFANGQEKVFYQQDTTKGNWFTVDEMRYFIYGEQDAMKGYKSPMTTVLGLIAGAGAGFFAMESLILLGAPLVYTAGNLIPYIIIDRKTVRNEKFLEQETYIQGYERVARSKKIQNALKSSAAGLAIGIGTYFLVKEFDK
ncbi:MAG: hypothetical protein ACK4IK_10315 [Bacteroidia bacterium]